LWVFFFSSRRRHTRSKRDWSSDVCSSDLGHPVANNQQTRTVGPRGPATLENYQFLEKISHFDRERIPERVVHARGKVAFGYFERSEERRVGKESRCGW